MNVTPHPGPFVSTRLVIIKSDIARFRAISRRFSGFSQCYSSGPRLGFFFKLIRGLILWVNFHRHRISYVISL